MGARDWGGRSLCRMQVLSSWSLMGRVASFLEEINGSWSCAVGLTPMPLVLCSKKGPGGPKLGACLHDKAHLCGAEGDAKESGGYGRVERSRKVA